MISLFAYGTLRDRDYQRALFARTFATRPATLHGWRVVAGERGYFTVIVDSQAVTSGDLVELDARALEQADRWEGAAYARRRTLAVEARGNSVPCWLYVAPSASLSAPPPGAFALHDRAAVLAAIRAFRSRQRG